MADVLLTHSYHLAYDRKQVRKMQPYLPLGTLYAASVLRSHGISVAVFDTMLHDPTTGFPAALKAHAPKIVAIYEDDFNFLSKMCLTRMRDVASLITEFARKSGALVIAHGSDATDHAEDYLRRGANYVLVGEAEITLTKLCSVLLGNGDPQSIEGVVERDSRGNLIQKRPALPKAASWVDLPTPARDLIDIEPYRRAWTISHGYFSINVVASRGCPYRCNWCAKPISGDKFHLRPAAVVADEILHLKQDYGAEHIWFGDDVFALSHHWADEFALEMESRQCKIPFKIQSRADLMTMGTVQALKRAGCSEVWMGIESGSQRVLDAMDKGLRVADIVSARKTLGDSGIRACYFLQFGYPGERWPDIQQTIALVRATCPDDIGVSVSYPLPNTAFYHKVQAQLGRKRNWIDSDDLCVMYTAEYADVFYHALRDALHAEVDSWQMKDCATSTSSHLASLWKRVIDLEPLSKNASPTSFSCCEEPRPTEVEQSQFFPLGQLSVAVREA